MTKAVLDMRLLGPADWRILRDTRLRALIDSPGAFTSHYHLERRWSEHQWRQRFRAATWVVAVERGTVIGIAGLVNDHPEEPEHVESIWVAPAHRCRGVSRSLLETMMGIAQRAGLAELLLWVLEDNVLARRIYAHLGFEWTGERKPIRPGHGRFERRLRRAI
jgi:ribosomal protein S18 acetylase RimI-like enzyme